MGEHQGGLMARQGRSRPRRSLVITLACALLAVLWVLGRDGTGPLASTATHARLWWYMNQAHHSLRPPSLHGLVRKEGPINTTLFYPPHGPPCKAERLAWVEAAAGRAANLTREQGAALLRRPPCIACQVFANHLYRIIYLRHPKVASSTVLDYFGLCNDERAGCLHPLEMDVGLLSTPPEVAARPGFQRLSLMSEAEVAALWADYFVFTVTRDPFDRAVSQYGFLMRSNLAEPQECRDATEQLVDWDTFCADPPSMARFCAQRPHCCKDVEGVYEGVGFKLAHIVPQAPCMTTPSGGLAVDFVARQEQLEADVAELVQHINARRNDGVPPLPLEGQLGTEKVRPRCGSGYSEYWRQHGVAEMQQGAHSWPGMVSREQYCTTDDFYSERHTHCRASVAAFYRQDFRLLYGGGGGGGGGAGGTGGGRRSGGA